MLLSIIPIVGCTSWSSITQKVINDLSYPSS
jgi:hypothetical protein